MGEKIINVSIADRQYKLTIEEGKEEKVREAEQLINEKIKEYSSGFSARDKQDLLSMIALQYITLYLDEQLKKEREYTKLSESLSVLEGIIDEQFKK